MFQGLVIDRQLALDHLLGLLKRVFVRFEQLGIKDLLDVDGDDNLGIRREVLRVRGLGPARQRERRHRQPRQKNTTKTRHGILLESKESRSERD